MKGSLSCFVLILSLMLALLSLSAAAYENPDRQLPLLVDESGLFGEDDYAELLYDLETVSEQLRCEIAAVFVSSLDGENVQVFSDDLYDYCGYGYGSGDDGIMLVVALNEREWCITTYGYGATAMNDFAIDVAEEKVIPYMSNGDYYSAVLMFSSLCELAVTEARNGTPLGYDSEYYSDSPSTVSILLVSLVIGLVIALIVTGTMRSQLKTVRPKNSASDYTVSGSMTLTNTRDIFLYRNVTKRAKPQNNSNGSGGSTMHRSSSGRSHGGRSGKF